MKLLERYKTFEQSGYDCGVPVRIMPDTHQGVNIVIGFTIPVESCQPQSYRSGYWLWNVVCRN